MKINIVSLIITVALCFACSSGINENPPNDKIYANYSKCLNEIGITKVEETPKTTIKWEFNDGILTIYHLNAGFNCCFDKIEISLDQTGNSLNIKETDIGDKCDCNCPRDIDYQVNSIPEGVYTIKISEAIGIGEFIPISFEANLQNGNNGEISFERPEYPWGIKKF